MNATKEIDLLLRKMTEKSKKYLVCRMKKNSSTGFISIDDFSIYR